jgi:glycosyltransferase involved in cell wall biosynthesis
MYQIAFVIEQALGHITHTKNLQNNIAPGSDIQPYWLPVPYETTGWAARLPLYRSNWTVRSGLRARRALADLSRAHKLDGLFIHTQVPGVLISDWARRYPTVVSLDATPVQYDQLGEVYHHSPGPEWLEKLKYRMNCNLFRAATHLVAWTNWTKASLVSDYHLPPGKITVVHPGVTPDQWSCPSRPLSESTGKAGQPPVRILFVGGDLARKGGDLLWEVFRELRITYPAVELHLVTKTSLPAEPGVFLYNDLGPNDPRLIQLYHQADLFVLPTLGDCLPMVLSEAGAAGLPCISTRVAGIPEIITDGKSGLLIPPKDGRALKAALVRMIEDPELRRRMGARAEQIVRQQFDSAKNTDQLLALLKETIDPGGADGFHGPSKKNSVLLTVSGEIPAGIQSDIKAGKRPRADYLELAAALPADLLDYRQMRQQASTFTRILDRLAGPNLALAWACFQKRDQYRVIFSDGEQVGIPLALLLKGFGRGPKKTRHMMLVHVLSVGKKMIFLDWLGLQSHIDRFLVYATWQKEFISQRWKVPPERVIWTPFMVDADFFRPDFSASLPSQIEQDRTTKAASARAPMICAVGLEFRDYPTLLEAVRGLDIRVVIAAASPWSKRADQTQGQSIPENVTVERFSQYELRQLYADSDFVVMPLYPVNFQAGVTAILEAMAMGKAVICTRTPGQTDVVEEGDTGLYVPPQDPAALRQAIQSLMDNPQEATRLGANGRKRVETEMNLEAYVSRLQGIAASMAQ